MSFLTEEQKKALAATASYIVADGKGILAADESTNTIGQRFKGIDVENNVDNRRAYRDLLFSADDELAKYIGGVIMYEETFYQKSSDGTPFPELLKKKGILTGIKVDEGLIVLPGTDGETTTQGMDNLGKRCAKYHADGAVFAKWRCALKIGKGMPSQQAVEENATVLARYAAICQQNNLVPIVEPEILMDGDHDLARAVQEATRVLSTVYHYLMKHNVYLEGTLLKPNMVCAGQNCPTKYSPQDVGFATVVALRRTVPAAVPGITFLSGGLSEEDATLYLNAMNQVNLLKPWKLSFSFGRALQKTVLNTWRGNADKVKDAQAALIKRARANNEAAQGKYTGNAADASSTQSLFVGNYTY